jgi:PAS domain S-box-containing protein
MEKAKLLIVEDEAIIAMEMESQLQSLGYEVTSIVDTGEKAIEKADTDKPDLILMDIRIKGEMDGIEAAEEIRNKFGIPVIFSTAYLDEERIERAKITMPFGYVLKPIQERDLKVTIEMALYVSKVDGERRKAEELLRKSEDALKKAQKMSKMGSWSFDMRKRQGIWSDECFSIFGIDGSEYPNGEVPESVWLGILEDPEEIQKRSDELAETSDYYEFEFKTAPIDGVVKHIHSYCEVERGNDGQILTVFGTDQDITERKQAENERDLFFQYSTEMLFIIGFDRKFKQVNPAFAKTFGWKEEELIDKYYLDFVHIDDKNSLKKDAEESKKAGKEVLEYEIRFRDSHGVYHRLSLSGIPIIDKQMTFTIARVVYE